MSNIYYSVITSEQGLQLYPSEASIKFLKINDTIINNNFQFLYTQLEAQKRNIEFLDLVNIIGSIETQDNWEKQVNDLLPGEVLCYQDTESYTFNGEVYQYGDYILKLPNQTIQKISGQAPLGFLPIINQNNSELTLYFYKTSSLDKTYKRITIDYTNTNPSYIGHTDSTSIALRLDSNGVFHDGPDSTNSPENAIGLVSQYKYKYNSAALTKDNQLMISAELKPNDYSITIEQVEKYYGIVKLYAQYKSNNTEIGGNIEEYCNGLDIIVNTTDKTITYRLKDTLKNAGLDVVWWLEVK